MFSRCHLLPLLRRAVLIREFLVSLLFLTLLLPAQAAPSWWTPRGVIVSGKTSDDFAAINQGQLKYLVSAAVAEMNAKLTDGAGTSLNALVNAWTTNPAGADDYAVVTVGQLKTVAKPVYERLLAAGAIEALPAWATDNGNDDFAVANIGQAKHLFAFEVLDQVSMLVMQALHVQQSMAIEQSSPNGLVVWLERNGAPVPNETVTFEIFQSLGGLVAVNDTNATPQPTFSLVSDASGYASCQFRAPAESAYSWVRATATGAAPQWFLMTVAGGSGSFPSNPPGITGVDFVQDPSLVDSDEDGVPDNEDMVPYDPLFLESRYNHSGNQTKTARGAGKYAVVDLGEGMPYQNHNYRAMGSRGAVVWGDVWFWDTLYAWSPEMDLTEPVCFTLSDIDSATGLDDVYIYDISDRGHVCGLGTDSDNADRVFTYNPFTGQSQVFPLSPAFGEHSNNGYESPSWGMGDGVLVTVRYYSEGKLRHRLALLSGSAEMVLEDQQEWDEPPTSATPSTIPAVISVGTVKYHSMSAYGGDGGMVRWSYLREAQAEDVFEDDVNGGIYSYRSYSDQHKTMTYRLHTPQGGVITLGQRDILTQSGMNFGNVSTHVPLPWLPGSKVGAGPPDQWADQIDHLWMPKEGGYLARRIYGSAEQYELERPLSWVQQINARGEILASGYMSDGRLDIGVWANGEGTSLEEMIGEETMAQYDYDWVIHGLSDLGTLAASVRRLSDNTKRMLLLVPVEWVTRGDGDELLQAYGAINGTAAPVIEAQVTGCSVSQAGVVSISVSGNVKDSTSDLIDIPDKQLETMSFKVPGGSQIINLNNSAQPELPWKPYKWESDFSASASFTVGGPGDYPVELTTELNAAGMASTTTLTVSVSEQTAHLELDTWAPETVDELRIYWGASTGGLEELFTETAADSNVFVRAGDPVATALRVEILNPSPLTSQADALSVRLRQPVPGEVDKVVNFSFDETGPSTRHFTFSRLYASCGSAFPATAPGVLMPLMVRLPAMAMFEADDFRFNTMDRDWKLKQLNLGDGEYCYVVDDQEKAVVFNPSANAHTHIQTKPINQKWLSEFKEQGNIVSAVLLERFDGLMIKGAPDHSILSHCLDPQTYERFPMVDRSVKGIYTNFRPKMDPNGNPMPVLLTGPPQDSETEILWRYVTAKNKVIYFDSVADLKQDIKYRKSVVEFAKSARFAYIGHGANIKPVKVNPQYWLGNLDNLGASFLSLSGGGVFEITVELKTENAFEAVDDIFKIILDQDGNPTSKSSYDYNNSYYAFACYGGANMVALRAIADAISPDEFTRIMGNAPMTTADSLGMIHTYTVTDSEEDQAFWIPGDWGFLQNLSHNELDPNQQNMNGENCIYLGGCYDTNVSSFKANADFWGHGLNQDTNNITKLKTLIDGLTVNFGTMRIAPIRRNFNPDYMRLP